MPQQTQFTPDMVYNLIANNPQGRAFVEQLARVNELQQAARQFAPQIQSFAQNPMQGMQQLGDWAQGMNYQNQMTQQGQTQPTNQQQQPAGNTPQEGGTPMGGNNGGGMMGMAMDIVGRFEKSLKEMSETIDEIKESNISLKESLKDMADNLGMLKSENVSLVSRISELLKDNDILLADISVIKQDFEKLVS